MTTKKYNFLLNFEIVLGNEETGAEELPKLLSEDFKNGVASELCHLDDYYDGFTDGLIGGCEVDVEKYSIAYNSDYEKAIHFLMSEISNILTDGDDFDFEQARTILKKIGIDVDEYFQP